MPRGHDPEAVLAGHGQIREGGFHISWKWARGRLNVNLISVFVSHEDGLALSS